MYVTCTKRHSLLFCRSFMNHNLFSHAAPVGNSTPYLNLERLAAGGLSSLKENKALLTPSSLLFLQVVKARFNSSIFEKFVKPEVKTR